MARHIELNPVSHVTIGTMGEPGNRTFYLQGSKGANLVSLIIEKQQATMLIDSFERLLEELAEQALENPDKIPPKEEEPLAVDMRLRKPIEVLFRVGNLGLGYSDQANRIVLVAYELVEEGEEPNVVSFWATQSQIKALIPHIEVVVKSGRPICGNCGDPIDADGHFCPRRNGHVH